MKKYKFILGLSLIIILGIFSCEKYNKDKNIDSLTKGEVCVYVDESLFPIIEEQKIVFESQYPEAKIKLIAKPELEISKLALEGNADFAILARDINKKELEYYQNKKARTKRTPIAFDAVTVIANKETSIDKISANQIEKLYKGTSNEFDLVFDNANSSTINYFLNKYNLKELPKNNITALNNNNEVIKFVSENKNVLGFVGVNWVTFPEGYEDKTMENVKILKLVVDDKNEIYPSQSDMSIKKYPFVRTVYMLNFKGRKGLGMGFASFIAGEVGQRIILKSGLLPFEIPTREIKVRKKI